MCLFQVNEDVLNAQSSYLDGAQGLYTVTDCNVNMYIIARDNLHGTLYRNVHLSDGKFSATYGMG